MARQRTPDQRLIDNLQRKIRHLNTKENKAKAEGNSFDEVGFKRNKENLKRMIESIRKNKKEGKLDDGRLNEYAEKAKNNPNYSADTKKIRKITEELIMSEPEDEEIIQAFNELMADPAYAEIMAKYANLSKKYIGASGKGNQVNQALDLAETIKATVEEQANNLTPQQINLLNKMSKAIEDAIQSRGEKGVLYSIK